MSRKIISIDDDPGMLRCIEKALVWKGYILLATTIPDEGIEMIRKDREIELALLDVKMPGKSGFETYTEIKRFRKLPVLFVTAYPRSFNTKSDEVYKMWKKEFSDGATDIIYKPFEVSTLFEKVEGLIGKAEKVEAK